MESVNSTKINESYKRYTLKKATNSKIQAKSQFNYKE